MTDIAAVGITIDSTQAEQRLKTLTGAAKETGRAIDSLPGSTGKASAALKESATATQQLEQRFNKLNEQIMRNERAAGLARHEMINLSRQIQDVGVSLASGQSPFMVLAQQGTQIADIFSSSKGSVRGFASQIGEMITPTRALGLGLGVLSVAVYAAYSSWKDFAKQLDDTARAAGMTSNALSKLQGAAAFKGIEAEDFSKAVGNIAAQVYLARTGAGDLANLFRANGVAAKGVADAVAKGADLIKNAGSDQQRLVLLQQMGLPATMQWVRFMSQGGDAIKRASDEMQGLSSKSDEMLAQQRKMDEAWNKFWTKAGETARNTFVTVATGFSSFIADLNKGLSQVKPPPMGTQIRIVADPANENRASGKKTVDPAEVARLNALEQQRLGILGQMLTVQQQIQAVTLQINAARAAGVPISEREQQNLERLAKERALGIDQVKSYRDQLETEAKAYGMSAGEAYAYQVVQEKINEAKRNGISIAPEYLAQLEQEAKLTGRIVDVNQRLKESRELIRGFGDDFLGAFLRGESAIKSASSALSSLMQRLASQTMRRLTEPGGSLFGNQSLTSAQGALGMASAAAGGYQSGSWASGMLGGALAGATFGPVGMLIGGGLGALGGLFGSNSQARRAEQQRRQEELQRQFDAQEAAWRLADRQRSIGRDTNTLGGALSAFDDNAAWQRHQEAAMGNRNLAELERTLAMERLSIMDDFAKAAEQRQLSYQDRCFKPANDNHEDVADTLLPFGEAEPEQERKAA